ncbi:hypothetical protein NCCP2716_27980 [Sporosarcina sp. NCCP-2716]|nr:hypothetical protein [Sporosarcina sp. NCCP-2716]GKV70300.1 hypothetical protein NCCP2716_27980 [Sporosarcina sp. NCCP-2716]
MTKTECAVCGKEIEVLEQRNGEQLCQDCYDNYKNEESDVVDNG